MSSRAARVGAGGAARSISCAHRISPASDIYLLGAILYEIVTGSPPHSGKDLKGCVVNAANNVSCELFPVMPVVVTCCGAINWITPEGNAVDEPEAEVFESGV